MMKIIDRAFTLLLRRRENDQLEAFQRLSAERDITPEAAYAELMELVGKVSTLPDLERLIAKRWFSAYKIEDAYVNKLDAMHAMLWLLQRNHFYAEVGEQQSPSKIAAAALQNATRN